MNRAASFRPTSYNQSDNSIEICWSVGAAGLRFDWLDGDYYIESLSMDPKHVRLDRLNAGACLIDSHNQGTVAAVLGSVVPGTAKVAGGEGLARVRLATTADVADTVAKIIDGHIRSVSVGYQVHKYERTAKPGERPTMHAIDWEPVELSMVVVPFDGAAQVRSEEIPMPEVIDNTNTEERATPARGAVTEALIRERCGRSEALGERFERELLAMHENEPLSRREFERMISDRLIDSRAKPTIDVREGGGSDPATQLRSRMADALYARMSGTAPADHAREFMGVRMVDMARGLMEARGTSCRWDSPTKIVERMGQHTMSDFPIAMANAARRYLIDTFSAYPSPLKVLARPRSAVDFRTITVAQVSANPQLLLVSENAEFTYGSFAEGAEAYRLQTYGRIFAISRQALVNDDLGMFSSVFQGWGRAGAELEANLLAGLISGDGGTLLDGNPLYSTARGNKAAVGGPINVESLSAARLAMRQMKDLDGFTPVNAAPKYLVVGAEKETEAEQVLAVLNAAESSHVNPFSGKLELLVDPRLPGKSWRLFADPAQFPTLEVARLAGQEDVFVDSQVGFDIDGIKTKARLDIGGAAIDWRGTYLNPGAA